MKLDHAKNLNRNYSTSLAKTRVLMKNTFIYKLYEHVFAIYNMQYRYGVDNSEIIELVLDDTLRDTGLTLSSYRRALASMEDQGYITKVQYQKKYQKNGGLIIRFNYEYLLGIVSLLNITEDPEVVDAICDAANERDIQTLKGYGYEPVKSPVIPIPKLPYSSGDVSESLSEIATESLNDQRLTENLAKVHTESQDNQRLSQTPMETHTEPQGLPILIAGVHTEFCNDSELTQSLEKSGFTKTIANLVVTDEGGAEKVIENITFWNSHRVSPELTENFSETLTEFHWNSHRVPYIGIKSIKEDYKKNLIQLDKISKENEELKKQLSILSEIKVLLEKNQNSSLEPVGSSSSKNLKSLEGNVKGNDEEYDETPSDAEYERRRQIEREKFFRTEAGRALSRALKDIYPHNTPAEKTEVEAALDILRAEYFSETGYNEKDEEVEILITETEYYQNQLSEEEIEAIEDENERRSVRAQQNMCDWYEQSKELDFVFGRALTSYGYITCLYLDEVDKTEEEELEEFAEKVKEARDAGGCFSESQYESNSDSRMYTLISKVEREFKENELFDFEYVRTAIMEWAIELDIFKSGDTKYYHPSLMNNINGMIRFSFLNDNKEVFRAHVETGEEYKQRTEAQAKEDKRKKLEKAENAQKIKEAKFDKLLTRFKLPIVKLKDGRIPVLKVAEMLHMNGYWDGDVFSFNLVEGLLRAWGRKLGSEKGGIYITDRFNHVFEVVSFHERMVAIVARMGNTFEAFGKPIPEPSPEWHERERIRVEVDTKENEEGAKELAEERDREEAAERYAREMDIKHGFAKPEDFEKPVPISANLPRNQKEPVSENVTENVANDEPKQLSQREKSRARRDKNKNNVIEA